MIARSACRSTPLATLAKRLMDLTQVDVEPSEASEVGMEPSEATSKESYFASQAKSAESKEWAKELVRDGDRKACLLYTSPSPRDATLSRMPSSA